MVLHSKTPKNSEAGTIKISHMMVDEIVGRPITQIRLNINIPITNTTDPAKVRSRNFTKLFFEETLNKRNQITSDITPPTISCELIPIFAF